MRSTGTLGSALAAGLACVSASHRLGCWRPRLASFSLAAVCLLVACATGSAATIDGYASMGASESAGTTYTGSWIPYLANQRGFDFGGAGQPYNVAVGGARSSTLLAQGQHTAVRNLVQNGDVELAFLFIGGNDYFNVGASIADGSLTGPALTSWAQSVVNNIGVAMDTVLSANPTGMVVAGLPDILRTPDGRSTFDTPAEIARGNIAVDLVNSLLKPAVLGRGQVFLDLATFQRDADSAPLVVGGVTIDTVNAGAAPTFLFQDGRHPAAVGNGLIANMFLSAVNIGYGTSYAPLSDLEILTTAGLASQYTGETSQLPYARYVFLPVPEPSSVTLAIASILCLAGSRYRRHTRRPRVVEIETAKAT